MFFKPKKRYLTELTIDLGYYQKVIIIHPILAIDLRGI
jgi:hypothetical protein